MGSAKIDLEEVGDEIAGKRGTVGVLCWAFMKGFIKVRFIALSVEERRRELTNGFNSLILLFSPATSSSRPPPLPKPPSPH